MKLAAPEQLHERARVKAFTADDIPYAMGVDHGRGFAPTSMCHLSYTPSYERLNEAERRLYSQIVGQAIAEQFIFLEEHLLIPALEGVMQRMGGRLGTTLRMCFLDFIAEEYKHSDMFWRLLETAYPDQYPQREAAVYRQSKLKARMLTLMTDWPTFLTVWIWLGVLFEERTIDLFRKYEADPAVDPLFKEVHRFHMLDEARHVRIEEHLLAEVYDRTPAWQRQLNARLLNRVLRMFTHPSTSPRVAIEIVMQRHPRLRAFAAEFDRDIAGLGQNMTFQQANFSRGVLPQTFNLLDEYPEMTHLREGLPLYNRK
ncbi:MAG: diiron oxygenase [Candidatus Sericytochromatia bacterium]|nr:diiron oxygenase [Candidatus Sericytochromatia bacterium]